MDAMTTVMVCVAVTLAALAIDAVTTRATRAAALHARAEVLTGIES